MHQSGLLSLSTGSPEHDFGSKKLPKNPDNNNNNECNVHTARFAVNCKDCSISSSGEVGRRRENLSYNRYN